MQYFSFISYASPTESGYPFNSYSNYNSSWPWFSFSEPPEILLYYSNLLRLQYQTPKNISAIQTLVTPIVMDQLPLQVQNAFNLNPTVQTINFSGTPVSGSFVLTYAGENSASISWNASLQTIQQTLNTLLGIGQVTVTGSIGFEGLVVTWNINQAPTLLSVTSNSLENTLSVPVSATLTTNQAQGVQLDVLGKYVGVTRNIVGSAGPIVLSDADFLALIQFSIIRNQQQSSLSTIVNLMYQYFPNQLQVFDYANTNPMSMSYLINSSAISTELLQAIIAENLLPQPMGVAVSVIAYPTIDLFFGYCDYVTATPTQPNTHNSSPYNCATTYALSNYNETWPYLDYADALQA